MAAARKMPGDVGTRVVQRKNGRAGVTERRIDAWWIVVRWDVPRVDPLGGTHETDTRPIKAIKVESKRDVAARAAKAAV